MAAALSEKVGRGICPNIGCGAEVTYRKSKGGLLTHRCDACDSNGYAEQNGAAYQKRMATLKIDVPASNAEPVASVIVPKKRPSAFSLDAL